MKVTVVYTMKGCPFCSMIKEELDKEDISFIERDIHEFEGEYDEFTKITENDYIPALMLLTLDENEEASNIQLLAPDRDFNDIYEGVELVKNYLLD
jgi:glutaredoxin